MNTAPTHIIGDPCYVLHTEGTEDLWVKSFCEALWKAQEAEDFDGHFEYMGHQIFVHGTAEGDGSYDGSDGRSYPVDAGLIGAIPVDLIEDEVVEEKLKDSDVRAVVMTKSQLSMADYEDGTFTFHTIEGRLEIKTSLEEEYECEDCGSLISEHEYHDDGVCQCCRADREEQEREEEDED